MFSGMISIFWCPEWPRLAQETGVTCWVDMLTRMALGLGFMALLFIFITSDSYAISMHVLFDFYFPPLFLNKCVDGSSPYSKHCFTISTSNVKNSLPHKVHLVRLNSGYIQVKRSLEIHSKAKTGRVNPEHIYKQVHGGFEKSILTYIARDGYTVHMKYIRAPPVTQ